MNTPQGQIGGIHRVSSQKGLLSAIYRQQALFNMAFSSKPCRICAAPVSLHTGSQRGVSHELKREKIHNGEENVDKTGQRDGAARRSTSVQPH